MRIHVAKIFDFELYCSIIYPVMSKFSVLPQYMIEQHGSVLISYSTAQNIVQYT